jgi:1-acyl-sn-glycerol-3-phosphate acyltransferase
MHHYAAPDTLAEETTPLAELSARPTPGAGKPAADHRRAHPRPLSGWLPLSPCGPACLPASCRPVAGARRRLRAAAAGLLLATAFLLAQADTLLLRRGDRGLRPLFRLFLRALGLRLKIHWPDSDTSAPHPSGRGTLLVSNHISAIDFAALNAVMPARLLVKSELTASPVLAALTKARATILVDRSRLRSLPDSVREVATALRTGATVAVFPEGTTWCGAAGGRYRPAFFQAAIDANAQVRPVVLRYRTLQGTPATDIAYVDTLAATLRRVLSARDVELHIDVLPAIHPRPGEDRRTLAARVQARVQAQVEARVQARVQTSAATPTHADQRVPAQER